MRHLILTTLFLISCIPIFSQTVCNVGIDIEQEGCEIAFSGYTSSGVSIQSFQWDFGDGGTSDEVNPIHRYLQNGTYTVYLSVITSDSCVSTSTKTVDVTECGTGCTADFTIINSSDCFISFGESSYTPFGTVTSYSWDFGDGGQSTNQYPSHTYNDSGTYAVTLIITTSEGCVASKTRDIEIKACQSECYADFSYFQKDDCAVEFSDRSSGDDSVVSWFWHFGDGKTATGPSPTNIFPGNGTWRVSLEITTSSGCQDFITQEVIVDQCNRPCTADFSYVTQDDCSVNFQGVQNPNDSVVTWSWYFGEEDEGAEIQNPSHTFPGPGEYFVGMAITTVSGCADTVMKKVVVQNCERDCYADFTYFQNELCEIEFFDRSNSEDSIIRWSWDFGDGHLGSGPDPEHLFPGPGDYRVILKILTADGCEAEKVQDVYVEECKGECYADFSYFQKEDCVVEFSDRSSGDDSVVVWEWFFGDGRSATGPSPTHVFPGNGTWRVSLKITTNSGCTDFISQEVIVDQCDRDCKADFQYVTQEDCSVDFFGEQNTGDTIVSWSWYFQDGIGSDKQNPSHTFSGPGEYFVGMAIKTASGCEDTVMKKIVVDNCERDCYADFSYFQKDDCEVEFYDRSSGEDSVFRWSWDFGDGHLGSGPNPTHIFPGRGIYVVVLQTESVNGCKDEKRQEVFIEECGEKCYADFSYFQNDSCVVEFSDRSSGDDSIIVWEWDFGDGRFATGPNPTHTFPGNGTWGVKLKILTASGCVDYIRQDVIVDQCTRDCKADFRYVVNEDCSVDFYGVPHDSNSVQIWDWYFPDGVADTGATVTHTFPGNGEYYIGLAITTVMGCTDTVMKKLVLDTCEETCYADFSYFSSDDCYFEFYDRSSTPDPIKYWKWDFGDGHTSEEQDPDHRFQQNGIYQVTLYIETLTCRDTIVQTVKAEGCEKECKANFMYEISKHLVYFKDLSERDVVSWDWDFGDGEGSEQVNPIHHYEEIGTYQVVLNITTRDGCSDVVRHNVRIGDCEQECKADFAYEAISDCGFEFEDFSTASVGDVFLWTWDFGDGNTGSGPDPTHSYEENGEYEVKLSITTNEGCSNSITHLISVRNCGDEDLCDASFKMEQDESNPFKYQFYAETPSNTAKYDWDFGDGNTSSLKNPSHTYTQQGPFIVALTVLEDNCIAKDSVHLSITTELAPELLDGKVELYPNPNSGSFQVEAQFKKALSIEWEILDIRGKRIMHDNLQQKSTQFAEQINIDDLALGVYFFQLISEEGILYREKIVKQ